MTRQFIDTAFLREAFRGNESAVEFVLLISDIADVWDNLVDRDVPVSNKEINETFWRALVDLPRNAFYRAHVNDLLPVMATGIVNWMVANKLQEAPVQDRALEVAHVTRYSIADVALLTAVLCGGAEWAEKVGPELRLRAQRSNFAEYMASLQRMED